MLYIYLILTILVQTIYGYNTDLENLNRKHQGSIYETAVRSKVHKIFINNLNREKRQLSFYSPKFPKDPGSNTQRYNSASRSIITSNNDRNFVNQNIVLNRTDGLLGNTTNPLWNSNNIDNYNVNNNNVSKEQSDKIYVKNGNFSSTRYKMGSLVVNTFMPKFNKIGSEDGSNNVKNVKYNITNGVNSINQYNYADPIKNNSKGYIPNESPNTGIGNESNYNDATIKPYAPGYLPIPKLPGRKTPDILSRWYNNLNVISEVLGIDNLGSAIVNTNVSSTTEIVLSGCNICSGDCPIGKHRSGIFCISDDYEYQ